MKKSKFISSFYFSLNHRGFGMIETLIAASIIGILCLGMGTVAVNMSKVQEQSNLYAVLNTLSNNMQKTIMDSNAWRNMVAASASGYNLSLSCIYSNTSCTATLGFPAAPGTEITTYTPFETLLDGNATPGTFYTDNISAGNGFTYAGTPCTGFVSDMSAAGTDQCPISYRLRTVFYCPNTAATCIGPSVIVFGFLQYHPGAHGVSFVVNTLRYSVNVTRTAGAYNRNDSVRVEDFTTLGANPLTTGGCASTGTFRVFQPYPLPATSDPATNVNNIDVGNTKIHLKPGGYNCTAFATGYAVDGFNVGLVVDNVEVATSPNAQAQSTTPYGMQQARISTVSINKTVAWTIQLRQSCQNPGTVAGKAFGLPIGFAGPPPIPDVFAGVYCTRVY